MKYKVSKKVWMRAAVGIATVSIVFSNFAGVAMAEEPTTEEIVIDEVIIDDTESEQDVVATENEQIVENQNAEELSEDVIIEEVVSDESEDELDGALKEYYENGIHYKEVNDGSYSAVSYDGNASYLTIPEKVDNRKVTIIAAGFLYNNANADKITNITLTNNIYRIEENAFRGCSNLQTINFGNKEVNYPFKDNVISTNLISIGKNAFNGCSSLTELDLSFDGIERIEEGAFSGCTSIKTIKLPSSLTYIGADAFLNCTGLAEGAVYYPRDIKDWLNIQYGAGAGAHPNYYAKNTYMTFYTEEQGWGFKTEHQYQPTEFEASESQRVIPAYAFAGFKELQEVNLSNCNTIGAGAFENCPKLYSVTLSDLLSGLGERAFMNDAKIGYVYIGNGLSTIPSKAFSGCSKLNNVRFSKNVNSIASDAFEDCTSMTLVYVYTNSKAASYFEYDFKETTSGTFVAYVDNTSSYQVDNTLIGYSGIYDGQIGLRFYFTKTGFDKTSTAKFMYTSARGEVVNEDISFSKAQESNDSYIFTVTFNPEDVSTKIGAKIVDKSGNESKTYWISFVDYAQQIISYPERYNATTRAVKYVKGLLTYGDAAQRYFGVNVGTIPSGFLLTGSNLYDSQLYLDVIYKGSSTPISNKDYLGSSILLGDSLSLKVYYKGNYSDITIELSKTFDGDINDFYKVEYIDNAITVVTFNDIYLNRGANYGTVPAVSRLFTIKYGSSGASDDVMLSSYLYLAANSGNEKLKYLADAIFTVDFNGADYSDVLIQKQ